MKREVLFVGKDGSVTLRLTKWLSEIPMLPASLQLFTASLARRRMAVFTLISVVKQLKNFSYFQVSWSLIMKAVIH